MKIIAFVLTAGLLAAPLQAEEQVYGAAGQASPLSGYPATSKAASFGPAAVVQVDGPEALLWNPGALTRNQSLQLGVHHNAWLVDTWQESLLASLPTGMGVFAAGVQYSDFGQFEVRNAGGVLTGSQQVFDASAALGWGLLVHPRLGLGFALRGQWHALAGEPVASAALDAGLDWKPPWADLRLGLGLTNLATPLGEDVQAMAMRIGLSQRFQLSQNYYLDLMGGSSIERGQTHRIGIGADLALAGRFHLRSSYTYGLEDSNLGAIQGLAAGMGVRLGGFEFDYSWIPFGELGDAHRIGMTMSFEAGISQEPAGEKRRKKRSGAAVDAGKVKTDKTQAQKAEEAKKKEALRVLFTVDESAPVVKPGSKEAKLLKAVSGAKASSKEWRALGDFYSRQGRKAEAEQALEEAARLQRLEKGSK